MKLFIVDEHEVVRRGIASILVEDGMEIVGEADTVQSALLRVPTVKPDVVVIASIYAVGDGVALCRELIAGTPGIPVLILTRLGDDAVAALDSGAGGVVDNKISAAELVAAVRTVDAGGTILDSHATAAVLQQLRHPTPPRTVFDELNVQEHRVLVLIGEGMTNKQIAASMFVAEKTVKGYVSAVLAKLHVTSRTQAAVAAIREDG